jgi:hypothetical protein
MKNQLFEKLMAGIQQAGAIGKGHNKHLRSLNF